MPPRRSAVEGASWHKDRFVVIALVFVRGATPLLERDSPRPVRLRPVNAACSARQFQRVLSLAFTPTMICRGEQSVCLSLGYCQTMAAKAHGLTVWAIRY